MELFTEVLILTVVYGRVGVYSGRKCKDCEKGNLSRDDIVVGFSFE